MNEHELSCTRVRRSDAGLIRLTGRDTAGLCLAAEQYAAPSLPSSAATSAPAPSAPTGASGACRPTASANTSGGEKPTYTHGSSSTPPDPAPLEGPARPTHGAFGMRPGKEEKTGQRENAPRPGLKLPDGPAPERTTRPPPHRPPPHEGSSPRTWPGMPIYPSGHGAAALTGAQSSAPRASPRPAALRSTANGTGSYPGPAEKCAHPAPGLPLSAPAGTRQGNPP